MALNPVWSIAALTAPDEISLAVNAATACSDAAAPRGTAMANLATKKLSSRMRSPGWLLADCTRAKRPSAKASAPPEASSAWPAASLATGMTLACFSIAVSTAVWPEPAADAMRSPARSRSAAVR